MVSIHQTMLAPRKEETMWLLTLLALAVFAFFLVKYVTAKASQQDSSASTAKIEDNQTPPAKTMTPKALAASDLSQTARAGETLHNAPESVYVTSPDSDSGLDTGDVRSDIREMIKILNLAPSDAARLSISRQAFTALSAGDDDHVQSTEEINAVADKLRHMLA